MDLRTVAPDRGEAVDQHVHADGERGDGERRHQHRRRAFREAAGESPDYIRAADDLLDPEALTFGFARRVATYKRLSLLLHQRAWRVPLRRKLT